MDRAHSTLRGLSFLNFHYAFSEVVKERGLIVFYVQLFSFRRNVPKNEIFYYRLYSL